MEILLLFAFVSGLVTIFAPCIWPLLPIILSSTVTGGKGKPLGITLGITVSFAFFTLTLSYILKVIPFDPEILRVVAVVIIGMLGISLVIPALSQRLEAVVSRFGSAVGSKFASKRNDFLGGFVTGASLGAVWSPCAGPILATIATLAATQQVGLKIVAVTLAYVAGVGVPLFIFASLGTLIFSKTQRLNKYTGRIQQAFGLLMIVTALAIYTNYDKVLQAKLLDAFPSYSNFILKLETNEKVKKELDKLKGTKQGENMQKFFSENSLPKLYKAPELVGINNWLNSSPLTIEGLKGKVILIDFWTYTCINCIRTLPHVTSWYEKYKEMGFVVIGVHTPEFEFEKKASNVSQAIKMYKINYPVAQDNDYATWKAYDNHYWPAKYLIDSQGFVRKVHFGEGEYEEMEMAIQKLLAEAGEEVDLGVGGLPDETPKASQTPETYLGFARIDRFGSREIPKIDTIRFSYSGSLPKDYFAFEGLWNMASEYSESFKGSKIYLNFRAEKVFLVMSPAKEGAKVKAYLDDKEVSDLQAGEDVKSGEVTLDMERLYKLIDLKGKRENHILRLEFDEGIKVFAFTFG